MLDGSLKLTEVEEESSLSLAALNEAVRMQKLLDDARLTNALISWCVACALILVAGAVCTASERTSKSIVGAVSEGVASKCVTAESVAAPESIAVIA